MLSLVKKFRLSFPDKATEAVFRHDLVNSVWLYYRYGSLLVAAGFACAALYYLQITGVFLPEIAIQTGLSLLCFALTLYRTPSTTKVVPWCIAMIALGSLLFAKYAYLVRNYAGYAQVLDRDVLAEIPAFYVLLRLRLKQATLVAVTYTAAIAFLCFVLHNVEFVNLPHFLFMVLAVHVISFSMAFGIERSARRSFLDRQTAIAERAKSELLLASMLPAAIVEQLKEKNNTVADRAPMVTVLFADLVGFTPLAARLAPEELLDLLNGIFTSFDLIVEQHGAEKIKTIGDAYMAVAGAPTPTKYHADIMADVAFAMQEEMRQLNSQRGTQLSLRIGMASGPVIAGVIGTKRFSYDLWGESVNLASRMESTSLADRIQIAPATRNSLSAAYRIEERGAIEVKGVGTITTYWLVSKNFVGRMVA